MTNTTLTVLISTYNRAESLRETLEAMCLVDCEGVVVEFVVIDNNSSDNTKEIVESFLHRLPLCYLFESRPGKNCALNKALIEVKLGEVVVFTDDDVTPQPDWLKEILASCWRNPEHAIGGGKVVNIWPRNDEPEWFRFSKTTCGLRGHNLGQKEMLYPNDNCPTGPNFWIRKTLFEKGLRFDESIGPSPVNRSMGSETSLFLELKSQGFSMVFCPKIVIHHRVQESLTTSQEIRRRAYASGRGQARITRYARQELYCKHHFLWRLRRIAAIGLAFIRILVANMFLSKSKRIGKALEPLADLSYNIELLKIDYNAREELIK